jgi:deazaflavin-dependent oxidoreductase (nitroreductase family)
MTSLDPQLEAKLRQYFKRGNPFMLGLWRLGLGQWLNAWPEYGGRIMVLTHVGRKTGIRHRTPLNYALVDGEIYCLAGFGSVTDWYRNIVKNREVEVWLPDGWWRGVAEDVSESAARLRILREVIIASGMAGRIFGFDARAMSDEEIDSATLKYRLLHIKRAEARTGPGGPGDLAWFWPLATMILLPMVLFRKR